MIAAARQIPHRRLPMPATATVSVPADAALLTCKQVAVIVQLAERTVRALVSSGRFPKPVRIGRSRRWRRSDVETWLAGLR